MTTATKNSEGGETRATSVQVSDVCPRRLPLLFPGSSNRGFTMIELIVVMLLLVTLAGLSVPQFSGFVEGHRLQEEGRRFIALTRFAHHEAISRSERVELWISPQKGQYGLRRSPYYQHPQHETVEFTLEEKISLKVDAKRLDKDGCAVIIYWPDGTLEPDGIEEFSFQDSQNGSVKIALDELGVNYEILDDNTNS